MAWALLPAKSPPVVVHSNQPNGLFPHWKLVGVARELHDIHANVAVVHVDRNTYVDGPEVGLRVGEVQNHAEVNQQGIACQERDLRLKPCSPKDQTAGVVEANGEVMPFKGGGCPCQTGTCLDMRPS